MRNVDVQPAPRIRISTIELEHVGRGWVCGVVRLVTVGDRGMEKLAVIMSVIFETVV